MINNLIEVDELKEWIDSPHPQPLIVAVMPRWRYWKARLPGSQQVWRDKLTAPNSQRLIDSAGFQAWARSIGVHNHSKVVLLDEKYDATRVWWTFQHYGHREVRVLNGGLRAWRRAGLPVQSGPPGPGRGWSLRRREQTKGSPGTFIARTGSIFPIAETGDVLRAQDQAVAQLWDTRELEEWSGRRRLRGARRAGRIPWSRHLCWREFREGNGLGTAFRPDQELQSVVECHGVDPSKDQVVYCQSGVRSTTMLFALARLGWDPSRLVNHDGSWREWSRDPELPILQDGWRAAGKTPEGENAL